MGKIEFNRLENFRKTVSSIGVSNDTADILCASWSKGTISQYQSAWILWANYCDNHKVDPCNTTIALFLDFLTEHYRSGKSYSILNTYRSAISSTHVCIDNVNLGKHPLVVRFFKGLINLRPPKSRYKLVWNVDLILDYLKTLWPLKDLTLKTVSLRLVALTALVTAQRVNTIKHLDTSCSSMFRDGRGVTFLIDKKLKTSKPGQVSEVFLEKFNEDPKLCVVKTLEYYLEVTSKFRTSTKLFLSFIKPHRPVTGATLARWLVTVLDLSGVNTKLFKAHSYRSASTSDARSKGVSLADIMRTANWKSTSVFAKFYNKPIDRSFAKSILSK